MDLASVINVSLLKRFMFILILTILLVAPLICWTHLPISVIAPVFPRKIRVNVEFPLNCSSYKQELPHQTCPNNYPSTFEPEIPTSSACPDYFRWIHEDLRPWKEKGITREVLEGGKKVAHFRLAIINSGVYFERFSKCFQTREDFTIWGILQLLRLYPGKVPDLELMFFCNDRTVVLKRDYQGINATSPPPVFHFCANDQSLDIVFPDWTFWGWTETNIKPWEATSRAIKASNKKTLWVERIPYAFWKGNSHVAPIREQLMECNVSKTRDWNARLYSLNWAKEHHKTFKETRLEEQCTHRYKIYIEGRTWSVSKKYILACNSMTLLVKPKFYDFFSRSLMPMEHYWPIRQARKCEDIKFAVEWGNNHIEEAQAIGEAGSKFVEENLNMGYIYDYMFHLLKGYAKLLKFKSRVPRGAKVEKICSERIACNMKRGRTKLMVESLVESPSRKLPCDLPPSFDAPTLEALSGRKASLEKQVARQVIQYLDNPERI